MFYCNTCAEEHGHPETPYKSLGKCECCQTSALCNDFPAKNLPAVDNFQPLGPTKAEVEAAIKSIEESR